MFCQKCGKNIDKGSKFCEYCGAPGASAYAQPRKKKKNTLSIALIALLAAAVILTAILLVSRPEIDKVFVHTEDIILDIG